MKSLIVFIVVLVLVAIVSYFVSAIPPGEILYTVLNLSNLVSFNPLILKSALSGLIWGIVISVIFFATTRQSKEKTLTETVEKPSV